MHPRLENFRSACAAIVAKNSAPTRIVQALAPEMHRLALSAGEFLQPCHRRGDRTHYARNLIFAGNDDPISLFTLVWTPGQWTPIHDHGTWGVVSVVEGMLEEQAFVRIDADTEQDRSEGIELLPAGSLLLAPGAVSTFVPHPDHIHQAGVAADRAPTLSLHLYGRFMNTYHVYDQTTGTRELIKADYTAS